MYVQVRMALRRFLKEPCGEGEVREMYLDSRGFVTTGVGNKLDNAGAANAFQWEKIANGAIALPSDVTAEFERVSSPDTKTKIPRWSIMGGGNFIVEAKRLGIVTLRLTDAAFAKIFNTARDGLEGAMKRTPGGAFADFEKLPGGFPADAQLGIMSVVWANGAGPLAPGERLAEFSNSCKLRQWGDIAAQEKYTWSNIRPERDQATKTVFQNAQAVEDQRQTMPLMDVTIVSRPFDVLALGP